MDNGTNQWFNISFAWFHPKIGVGGGHGGGGSGGGGGHGGGGGGSVVQIVKAFNGLPRGAKLQLILKREERDCNRYKGLVGKHHRGESVCWEFHKNLTKFAKNRKSSQKHFQHVTPTLRWERTNQATSLGEIFVKRLARLSFV